MPDEASTPPADTQAPPSEPVTPPAAEPTPPPESVAPAPETPPTETPAQAEVSEPVPEPATESAASTPAPEPTPEPQQTSQPQPATTVIRPTGDLVAANAKIQATKRKRLDKIMAAIEGKGPTTLKLRRANAITNDEVEKLLRVSDATATRYLDTLEKEGRVRQEGKTGKGVVYVRI